MLLQSDEEADVHWVILAAVTLQVPLQEVMWLQPGVPPKALLSAITLLQVAEQGAAPASESATPADALGLI